MEFRTVSDLNELVARNLSRVPNEVDLVVGIPRSGMLVATLLSLYKNIPLTDLDSYLSGQLYKCGNTKKRDDWVSTVEEARTVLVVDDSLASGAALAAAKKRVEQDRPDSHAIYLVAYAAPGSLHCCDIALEECPMPRMFEWNYLHHPDLGQVCFDIDGVLCDDPSEEQNDDGDRYIDFILHAPLKVRPTYRIGCLVTSRLERYRCFTEQWLEDNGIEYGELVMSQCATKEERQRAGNHGLLKAEAYGARQDFHLFVESNPAQARTISELTGKAVFCTDDRRVYGEGGLAKAKSAASAAKQRAEGVAKRILPDPVKKTIKAIKRGGGRG